MILTAYLLMCAIFGTTFLAIKIGVESGLPPFFAAGLRFFIAGLLLFLWLLAQRKATLRMLLDRKFWLIGLGSTFFTFATLYWAEQHIDSGIAAMLSATGPMMILVLQSAIARQSPPGGAFLGCAVGFAGVFVLLLPKLGIGTDALWLLSCLLVLLGELGYAAGSLFTRKVMMEAKETPPIAVNAVQMMFGGLSLLLLSAFTEEFRPAAFGSWAAAGSLVYLIVVGSMIGHSLYAWLLKATNAFFPSTWLYVSPIIALGLGAALYDEQLNGYSVVGSAFVLAGIVLTNWREWGPRLRRTAVSRQST
ncbi:DMT family transporter [Paenibacillus methanolicus]|uniref:Drug/metabolite transporter (DMT)-like permease n=1 Tax=Paenibacillus methanolicus TaxID=582686 RepID=A0A5S5CL79_9BACL|nr:EamA family transporter [Paenibacillus methanolicus]TYP79713.1 drug/metabolite transporter (DMT)-like permease [Paenibacillus methanolicus]